MPGFLKTTETLKNQEKLQRQANWTKRVFFLLAFVSLCAVGTFYLYSAFVVIFDATDIQDKAPRLLSMSSCCLTALVGTAILYSIARFFECIAKAKSPITTKQAKRMRTIALLLLISAALETFSQSIFGSYHPVINFGNVWALEACPNIEGSTLSIDFERLIGALFCYCLSYIFKYMAYLQELSDETI